MPFTGHSLFSNISNYDVINRRRRYIMNHYIDFGLFAVLFIAQFVGHRIGDFMFQTDMQARKKTIDPLYLIKHAVVYSLCVTLPVIFFVYDIEVLMLIFTLTLVEHMAVDDRRVVIWWKHFLETKLAGRKDFNIEDVPSFVIIEIDQTIHYTRIFIISTFIAMVLPIFH